MFGQKKTYECFSQDTLWSMNDKIYTQDKGEAWSKVPMLYTVNCKVANYYANCIAQLMKAHPNTKAQILELGCGLGAFSYYLHYFLKKLNVDFHITLSDMSDTSLEYLKLLPQWQDLSVDWLAIDVRKDVDLSSIGEGPLFVICNYFADSMPFIGLKKDASGWHHATVRVDECDKFNQENISDFKIDVNFNTFDIEKMPRIVQELLPLYDDFDGNLNIPTVMIDFFDRIKKQRPLVYGMFNDKGFSKVDENSYDEHFDFNVDGAIHYMVNFEAINHWVDLQEGCHAICSSKGYSHLNFIALGDFPSHQKTIMDSLMVGFHWRDNFDMIMESTDFLNDNTDHFNQLMGFCDYCPGVFFKLSNAFLKFAKENPGEHKKLLVLCHKIIDKLYWHPLFECDVFVIIEILIILKDSDTALELLKTYQPFINSQYLLNLHFGVLYFSLKQFDESKKRLNLALNFNKKCPNAKKYLDLMA